MSIALPAMSRWATVTERLVQAGSEVQGYLGGETQLLLRLGDRFGVDVTLPNMLERAAAPWIAAQVQSRTEGQTLVLAWPQPAFVQPIGKPNVSGANQTGARLNIKNMTPGFRLKAKTFFSFVANGRNYLHMVTQDVTIDANAANQTQLCIAPVLRVSPAGLTALNFLTPQIEGFMSAAPQWTLDKRRIFGSLSFTLTENE